MTQDGNDLDIRIRLLEDKLAILDLYSAYAVALDDKDPSLMAAVFDEESRFECGIQGAPPRTGVEGNWKRLMQRHAERQFVERHLTSTPVVTKMERDRAEAMAECVIVVRENGGPPRLENIGRYEDVIVRRGGRWVFADRRYVPDA
jgi:hypothetical protein